MCQPKTNPIPQASTKAAPPPEETAQNILTAQEEQDALTIKKKKKGLQSLQNYRAGASPLAIPSNKGNLNVP